MVIFAAKTAHSPTVLEVVAGAGARKEATADFTTGLLALVGKSDFIVAGKDVAKIKPD